MASLPASFRTFRTENARGEPITCDRPKKKEFYVFSIDPPTDQWPAPVARGGRTQLNPFLNASP
jgi:hypothetical protein